MIVTTSSDARSGGAVDAAPLSTEELRGFGTRALADSRLTDTARERAAEAISTLLEAAEVQSGLALLPALLDRWLGELEEMLGVPVLATVPDLRRKHLKRHEDRIQSGD